MGVSKKLGLNSSSSPQPPKMQNSYYYNFNFHCLFNQNTFPELRNGEKSENAVLWHWALSYDLDIQ